MGLAAGQENENVAGIDDMAAGRRVKKVGLYMPGRWLCGANRPGSVRAAGWNEIMTLSP